MRSFGHLEREVMRAVWRAEEPVTGHEIADALKGSKEIAYTTLLTVIDRLREKGYLTRTRDGRSYRYRAVMPEADYAASLMSQVLDASDNRSDALLSFAGKLEPAEAEALRAALRSHGGE
jgi:predicted transcriptional regulator